MRKLINEGRSWNCFERNVLPLQGVSRQRQIGILFVSNNLTCLLFVAAFTDCTPASRLSDAEAPKEISNFLRQQRDLVEEERRHRKEATEILRRFRADENGIPSVVSCQKQLEVEKHRQKEAIAFLHSYRASKESILRRTQGFWKTNTPSNQGIAVPSIPLFDAVEACARQWDDTCDQELLDDLISEAEFLSSSPDKNELLEDLPHQNDASKRTILWLSLMVLFSRNIVGLVLSLSLLNYTLRSGKQKHSRCGSRNSWHIHANVHVEKMQKISRDSSLRSVMTCSSHFGERLFISFKCPQGRRKSCHPVII